MKNTIFTGPVKSEKTKKLLTKIHNLVTLDSNVGVLCFKSKLDTRDLGVIRSRCDSTPGVRCVTVDRSTDILYHLYQFEQEGVSYLTHLSCAPIAADDYGFQHTLLDRKLSVIAIDELFMMDSTISYVLGILKDKYCILSSSLVRDYRQEEFVLGPTPLRMTDLITQVFHTEQPCLATCDVCGSSQGEYTQRIVNGICASWSLPTLDIHGSEYQARCKECYIEYRRP